VDLSKLGGISMREQIVVVSDRVLGSGSTLNFLSFGKESKELTTFAELN